MRALAAALGMLALAALPASAAVYWGDVHAHSNLSFDATGSGSPDNFFTVARDVVGLDFVTLTDHDLFRVPEDYDIVKATAASFEVEGTFLAIPGMEWTRVWHMNVYFQSNDAAYCTTCAVPAFNELYGDAVRAGAAAAHVNHPQPTYPVSWDMIDDGVTTNVEVFNAGDLNDLEVGFGRVLWALRAGFKLGMVGVSDDHDVGRAALLMGKGLTGCPADRLTRANILAALRARRCWATSGERITMAFSVNGVGMGGETTGTIGRSVSATFEVMGTAVPTRLDVLRDGDVVASKTDCAAPGCVFTAPVPVTDLKHVVYARVTQPGDEKGWASPVWVAGACAANDRKCARRGWVPGGGPRKSDCLHEWRSPVKASRARLSCRDGDARCDAGTTAGECTFRVGFCTSQARLRGCTPARLTHWELTSPPESEATAGTVELENRRTILAAAHVLGDPPGAGCTPLLDLRVPVDTAGAKPKTGTRTFVASAVAGGQADRDALVLRCLPARGKAALVTLP